jgi:hypothetical protein
MSRANNHKSPKWTDAENATLVRMCAEMATNEQISVALGRSVSAVAIHKTKLKKVHGESLVMAGRRKHIDDRKLPPLISQFRHHALSRGMKVADIAHKSGCGEWSISAWGRVSPSLFDFEAAAQAVGLRIALIPIGDAA